MPTKKDWDILAEIHSHPRDKRIAFQEDGHRYIIDGKMDGWKSATSILSAFHPSEFDPDKASDMVIKSRRYRDGSHPLSGKSKEYIQAHWALENKRGTALHARMERYMQDSHLGELEFIRLKSKGGIKRVTGTFKESKHRVFYEHDTGKVYITYPLGDSGSVNVLYLGYLWDDDTVRRNRRIDAELGDEEPLLGWDESIIESLQLKQFWETLSLKPYRSEWVIWDDVYQIAGTLDALMINPATGGYWIYDWKRVRKGLEVDISATKYGYKPLEDEWLTEVARWVTPMKEPLDDLYDTKYWHYSLQLNLYKSILERRYGINIEGMMLVQIHPSLAQVQCHEVVPLPDHINRILELRKKELTERAPASSADA